jgi:hypothetical protein
VVALFKNWTPFKRLMLQQTGTSHCLQQQQTTTAEPHQRTSISLPSGVNKFNPFTQYQYDATNQ